LVFGSQDIHEISAVKNAGCAKPKIAIKAIRITYIAYFADERLGIEVPSGNRIGFHIS
jgi:hypothetical protein